MMGMKNRANVNKIGRDWQDRDLIRRRRKKDKSKKKKTAKGKS